LECIEEERRIGEGWWRWNDVYIYSKGDSGNEERKEGKEEGQRMRGREKKTRDWDTPTEGTTCHQECLDPS
jgi:hypothetical protein